MASPIWRDNFSVAFSISATIIRARLSSGVLASSRVPAAIAISVLRMSWPSPARKVCFRASFSAFIAVMRALLSSSWAIKLAKRLNMPSTLGLFSVFGCGSMAQSVPKKRPSAITMGTEM
jgi:hypothetical protein